MLRALSRLGDLEHHVTAGTKWKDGFQAAKNEALQLSKSIERLYFGELDACMELLCTRLMLLLEANRKETWEVQSFFGFGETALALNPEQENQLLQLLRRTSNERVPVKERRQKGLRQGKKGEGKGERERERESS